jgi:ATP-dependent RNA helicase DDX60
MAGHILSVLEKTEQAWREQSPEWKHKVSQWEAWLARQKNKERVAQKAAARKRDPSDDEPQQSEDRSWESCFDPRDPSPQFSFASASAYPKKGLLADIDSIKWAKTPDFLLRALWRGIAVHHSGMNKVYRALVERCALSPCRTTRS